MNARRTLSRNGRGRCLVPLSRAARPLTGATSELRLAAHGARRPRLPRFTRHLPRNLDVIRRRLSHSIVTLALGAHWSRGAEALWRSGRHGSPDRARSLWGSASSRSWRRAARPGPRSARPATGIGIRILDSSEVPLVMDRAATPRPRVDARTTPSAMPARPEAQNRVRVRPFARIGDRRKSRYALVRIRLPGVRSALRSARPQFANTRMPVVSRVGSGTAAVDVRRAHRRHRDVDTSCQPVRRLWRPAWGRGMFA